MQFNHYKANCQDTESGDMQNRPASSLLAGQSNLPKAEASGHSFIHDVTTVWALFKYVYIAIRLEVRNGIVKETHSCPQRRSRFAQHYSALANLILLTTAICLHAQVASPRLWYRQPATKWDEALPLGNGRIGAMLFGGTSEEHLQLNEGTLWGGLPHDYANPEAAALLPKLRDLIFSGHADQAEALASGVLGTPRSLMPYLAFCDLHLRFPGLEKGEEYQRQLLLDRATATVTFRVGSITYKREAFISYPDNVLVVRLTANSDRALNFKLSLDSPHSGASVKAIDNHSLLLLGQVQPRENPVNMHPEVDPEISWASSYNKPGLRFAARAELLLEDGKVANVGSGLEVSQATAVTLIFTCATSFVDFQHVDGDPLAKTLTTLNRAQTLSYAQLLRNHLSDYQPLFSRVSLRLGSAEDDWPTDVRLREIRSKDDPALFALYYQFGRYALLASSRVGGQPANLQGIWNDSLLPPWGSKWTTNINLEMNYWSAESGGLPEAEEPLWDLIGGLEKTGAVTARTMYGQDGWVLHHNTDLWRATAPVDGAWGVWPVGAVWLANQMWSHYEFTGDRVFLHDKAYPAMKGAAEFVMGVLVKAPEGTAAAGMLVTNPSVSPENEYLLNGKRVHITYAPTMDIELIDELLRHVQDASQTLGIDSEFALEAEKVRKQLPPLRIGAQGKLQEWIEDYPETDPQHRHLSHLYALYPGDGIDIEKTPELAQAAKRSLEIRGDQSTGWAEAWRAVLWARLHDGDHAHKVLTKLLANNTLSNMFDVCPPFQIDGNFGGPAAIAEMLVQSQNNVLQLLPALPTAWQQGELRGLKARRGLTVDLSWQSGKLATATIRATTRGTYRVESGKHTVDLELLPGHPARLNADLTRVQ
jgi:alpha-L-fucosidase 2